MAAKTSADIPFGATARDIITGFRGVVVGKTQYISGCDQVLLSPRVAEGSNKCDPCWFDAQRIEVDPAVERVVLDNSATPGADLPAPIR